MSMPQIILPIIILAFSFLGLVLNSKKLYGSAIAAMLPTFLYSLLDIFLENYEIVPFNIIALVVGIIVFEKKEMPDWKIILSWGILYLFGAVILDFIFFYDIILEYNVALGGVPFLIYLIANPIIIIILINLKKKSKMGMVQHEPTKSVMKIQKTLDKNMKKFQDKYGYNFVTDHIDWVIMLAIGIGWGLIKGTLYPLSGWAFAISICLLFYNNKFFSSYVVGLILPLSYLILITGFEHSFLWYFNLFYHLFIMGIGMWVVLRKRDANWEVLLIYSLVLKIYVIIMHNAVGYLPDGGNLIHLSYIDTIIIVLIVFFYHNYRWNEFIRVKEIAEQINKI